MSAYTLPMEQKSAMHWTNLRTIDARDNRAKALHMPIEIDEQIHYQLIDDFRDFMSRVYPHIPY